MPAELAILLCAVGVAVLFYLDRDKSSRNSKALWIPVIWLWLIGSRPVSSWFGISGPASDVEGSPVDAAVSAALIAIGAIVLLSRRKKTASYIVSIAPIIIYFTYALVSVSWSPVPVPSLKRWIRDVGDLIMVLVIVTDNQPLVAIRRLFSRVGFVLFPLSMVLIRYTVLGRQWDQDGNLSIVGVTANKNMFGLILFVISLGSLWNCRWLLMNKRESGRRRRLIAQGVLLAFGLMLLNMAHSSTSLACFLLGSGLILCMNLRTIRARPSRAKIFGAAIFALGGIAFFFGGSGDIASALGRDSTFSGRTVIWDALLPTVSNPIFGTGFDSYWDSPNVLAFQHTLKSIGWYHPEHLNEAHNGYLEVYLNLGWVGVCLLLFLLIVGYWRACNAFGRAHETGSITIAYIVTGMIYGITEAGFRTMGASWFFMLLAIAGASGVNEGLFADETAKDRVSRRRKAQPLVSALEDVISRGNHSISASGSADEVLPERWS